MINWNRIEELKEEVGKEDLAEVLGLFCEEVEESLSSLSAGDIAGLKGQLHFLKGSALNIGLDQVSTLCRDAEQALANDPDFAPPIDAIRNAYENARAALQDLL